ncbi:hypothetical protein [Lederbergia lenta]|uniref:Uncharacterized protein n=1 Tax=Lederbergia lenta TaxID=1467 RepID=A0A2X4WC76_LEDLE|nr:hypothetical protein [Lederbergia lenta]MCM3110353.1 hypothetical protein [Lederbergia lenta]MEC2324079.1 hypothetical protein [Lederbergia lenta]SQI60653.1 Uncharacterised protein [Lederbergia lenta]
MKKSLKEILAPMSKAEKMKYIWHYYRFHMLGALLLIIIVAVSVNSINNKKDTLMNVMIVGELINTEKVSEIKQSLNEELLSKAEQDSAEISVQEITYSLNDMNPQMQAGLQKMAAELSAGYVDILLVEKSFFDDMNKDGQLLDLQDLYGNQPLPIGEEHKYFAEDNGVITGINVTAIKQFEEVIFDENIVMCVPANTKNEEFITRYLQYVFKK